MIYIVVFCYLFISYVISGFRKKQNSVVVDCLLILPIILIAGLRYRIGGDTYFYMKWYEFMPTLDRVAFYDIVKFQPFWIISVASFKSLQLSYFHFQFFHAVVLNLSYVWLLRKYKFNVALGVLLYFVLIAGRFNFEILRESLAIVFFFHGYYHFSKKQHLFSFVFFLVGFLFHVSVLIAIPILFIRINKKFLWPITLAFILCSFVVEYFFLDFISNYTIYVPTVYGIIYNVFFSVLFLWLLSRFIDRKYVRQELNTLFYSLVFATILSIKYFIFFRLYNYIDILFILLLLRSYSLSRVIDRSKKILNMTVIITCIICVRIMPLCFVHGGESEIPWIRQWYPYESIITGKENQEREQYFKNL